MRGGASASNRLITAAPQRIKLHYFSQARNLTLSLGVVLISIISRLLASNPSHHMHDRIELIISIVLISFGSIHGSLDIFKLRNINYGIIRNNKATPIAAYLALVFLGATSLIFSPQISTLLFILLSLAHFSIVEFTKKRDATNSRYRVLGSIAMVFAVFAVTFRSYSSISSAFLLRLVGDGPLVTTLLGWTSYLAIASFAVLVVVAFVASGSLRDFVDDLSLVIALMVAPSLVAFALYYCFRHGVDQWVMDRGATDLVSVDTRVLLKVLMATVVLLLATIFMVGPLIAFVALGFGLTLAHVALDFGLRLGL